MSFTSISLSPTPGFCIKTSTLQSAILPPASSSSSQSPPTSSSAPGGLLEPSATQSIPVPKGLKIFVNVAWDKNVPPPPEGSEDVIQAAMKTGFEGECSDKERNLIANREGWYVPVVVSEPRQDSDKAGNASLVVDCVYNKSVKNRTLRDPEFKIFLVELALQRIEAQTGLVLSRQIGIPNIAAKGKLLPRRVKIPTVLLLPIPLPSATSGPSGMSDRGKVAVQNTVPMHRVEDEAKRPLIQELVTSPQGILKTTTYEEGKKNQKGAAGKLGPVSALEYSWTWETLDSGGLCVKIHVPGLTTASITSGHTSLDVEARRIILHVSDRGESGEVVDIDVGPSDAQIVSRAHAKAREKADRLALKMKKEGKKKKEIEEAKSDEMSDSDKEVTKALMLKRERDFDVDRAEAEWRVKEEVIILLV